jgi:hypothetical protein
MSYFAAAIVCLLIGLALMACGIGFPAADLGAPDTLVVVHVIALGWLGLLFCGALLQFVPVLAATPARMPALSAPSLVCIICGLVCLVCGFLSLGGHFDIDPVVMLPGATLLVVGLGGLAVCFAATILAQKAVDLAGRLVLLGLLALLATIGMGAMFAASLSGSFGASFVADLLAVGVPTHAASGILGWMTLTAAGVGYRLFAMFMLAPEVGFSARRVIAGASAALTFLYGSLATAFAAPQAASAIALLAILVAIATATFYLRDLVKMLRLRRRKRLELNTASGLAAFGFLAVALLLLALSQMTDNDLRCGSTAYYLLAMGWLSGLGLAQLYKIIPFLTWLEVYGSVMGRAAVPRVQDLVNEPRARLWFVVYYSSVFVGAACLLFDADSGFRAAAACQFIAVIALAIEYMRARRLSYAPAEMRFPGGVIRPHLIYAKPN